MIYKYTQNIFFINNNITIILYFAVSNCPRTCLDFVLQHSYSSKFHHFFSRIEYRFVVSTEPSVIIEPRESLLGFSQFCRFTQKTEELRINVWNIVIRMIANLVFAHCSRLLLERNNSRFNIVMDLQ